MKNRFPQTIEYYLCFPNTVTIQPMLIGTETNGIFWPDTGFEYIEYMLNKCDASLLELCHVKSSNTQDIILVEDFIYKISKLKLKTNE